MLASCDPHGEPTTPGAGDLRSAASAWSHRGWRLHPRSGSTCDSDEDDAATPVTSAWTGRSSPPPDRSRHWGDSRRIAVEVIMAATMPASRTANHSRRR